MTDADDVAREAARQKVLSELADNILAGRKFAWRMMKLTAGIGALAATMSVIAYHVMGFLNSYHEWMKAK